MARKRLFTGKSKRGHLNQIGNAPEPIWQAQNVGDVELLLSDIAPGFTGRNGWLMTRFRPTALPTIGASTYFSCISDDSASNIIGFRVRNNSDDVQFRDYHRVDPSNYEGHISNRKVADYEVKTAIMTWNDLGDKFILVDDYYDIEPRDAGGVFPLGTLTHVNTGSRNGGQNPLIGDILHMEIGDQYLSLEQAVARRKAILEQIEPLVVGFGGQSNIQNWEDGVEDDDANTGRQAFVSALAKTNSATYAGRDVIQVHAAEGGSSLRNDIEAVEYWLTNNGQAGPELIEFFFKMDNIGITPKYILWDQGEAESHKINHASWPTVTTATYKGALFAIFALMRQRYPGVQIVIGKLGIRTAFSNADGIQIIADIQQELIDEHDWIHFGWERFDLGLWTDGTHYLDASYGTQGGRGGRRVAALEGIAVAGGTLGILLGSATRSGTSLTINLLHDGGTDFTPTSAIEGFHYLDGNGDAVALSSVARSDGNTITATLASGVAGTLYYMYNNPAVTLANLVKDNGAHTLPLQRGKVTVA